jgi:isopentenyldiphosphate isomerase
VEVGRSIRSVVENSMEKFKPKPGQVDFSNARFAPVINCVLKCKNKILIVQRSKDLNFYPEFWNGISGFLDDLQTLKQKVEGEIKEELGIAKKDIISIKFGSIFHQEAPKYKKTWIVHPILVEVETDKIKLDWEAQDYKWIKFQEIKNFKLLPGFDEVVKRVKNL